MGYVRAYEPGDEQYIAACLRKADRQELSALSDRDPVEVLREGGMISRLCVTIIGNSGLGAGMCGVVDEGNGVGKIWMLGTAELVSRPMQKQFLRESKLYLRGLERIYRLIHNTIDERNTVHIRWLRFMGFTFIQRIPEHGIRRLPFWEFTKLGSTNQSKWADEDKFSSQTSCCGTKVGV